MRFDEQVDLCLQNKYDIYSDLLVCETPQCLIDLGCNPLPMLYTKKHFMDAIKPKDPAGIKHYHGIKIDLMKKMPSLIADPVMIYKSSPKKGLKRNPNSIVIVTSETDDDKLPVIVSICLDGMGRINSKQCPSNFITSIYGRNHFDNQLEYSIIHNELLFIDKQKSQELFSVIGTRLTSRLNNLDYNKIIRLDGAIVNKNTLKIQKNIKKMQKIEISLSDLKEDKELLKMKYEKRSPQISEKAKEEEL